MLLNSSLSPSSLELSDTAVGNAHAVYSQPSQNNYQDFADAQPGRALKTQPDGAQWIAQFVGQHILLDVQGAVLALVVRQFNTNLSSKHKQ